MNRWSLGANEVAWGRLGDLEDFCVANGLPFQRAGAEATPAVGRCSGTAFDGLTGFRSYTVTDNDIVVVTEPEVRSLGTFGAIGAYLQSASLELPPLTIVDEGEQDHG